MNIVAVGGTSHMAWNKRGRPKNQKPKGPDRGPVEQQARRKALVGDGGDASLAGYPLGVMKARNMITADQHDAGLRYLIAYGRTFKRPKIGEQDIGDVPVLDGSASASFAHTCIDALQLRGRKVRDDVDNVVLWDRWPAALMPDTIPTASDYKHIERIKEGLDALLAVVHGQRVGKIAA